MKLRRRYGFGFLLAAAVIAVAIAGYLFDADATVSITNTSISTTILSTLVNNALDLPGASATSPTAYNTQLVFTNGTGAKQANILWSDERTISASSSETLQVTTSGALKDAFGNTINLSSIRALLIRAVPGNTNNVVVGNATNPWVGPFDAGTDTVSIQPGGFFLVVAPTAAGYSVTASTADEIKVANSSSGSSVTYDIYILGTE